MKRGASDFNPWKRPYHRYKHSPEEEDCIRHASKRPQFSQFPVNVHLDFSTKRAALKASPSTVALESYSGAEMLSQGCGTIIETEEDNTVVVLTSANLIRRPTKAAICENALADDLQVFVHSSDEISYKGDIYAFDFHYNLLTIKFKPDTSLPAASLRVIDDGRSLCSIDKSFTLRPHSVKLEAGDPVIAVGRYFVKPFDLMVAPGCFCHDKTKLDCKELCVATCRITKCGDGGPLVNLSGEVIGVYFYDHFGITPFLPINIARKWWEHYKIHGELRNPYLGFEVTNLYVAGINLVDRVTRRFPSICSGILVEKMVPGSSAESAGLQQDDIIVKCNGKAVESCLELWEVMWDEVGCVVELMLARAECRSFLSLNMMVVEAMPGEWYRWPKRC